MNEPLSREVALLNEALELPMENRAAYLNKACAGDEDLRRQVQELLRANEEALGFLNDPAGFNKSAQIAPSEKPGDHIGRYKLLQQIGEGGCGVVYMAEQTEPVRRRVALKVIKLGMDTKQVIARFEAERQALALMDHPNIAKVLDAGATNTGRPFFVMELVRGAKITDFCEEHTFPTEERLKLFIQICHAIQHAHQKGVIHRDIKPSNILVTVNDGVPVPKVIDFGIAKATQGRLTDQTLFTAFEQFIGTPAYMSPEQAVMTSLDVDTRSDIYSLGVLLYELLTGRTPFDQKELLAAGLDEMRRTIREVEPVKPSTRLTEDLAKVGKRESEKAGQLIPALRGDLDWIVMKCLEKDRGRRYATVNGLASDIQRHLDNKPVTARPPSNLYRLQKAVRRNKAAFAAVTAVTVVMMVAVIASTSQGIRARRAEREQTRLRQQAERSNRDLREAVSVLELERAEDLFRSGDRGMGTAHLAAMLRGDPSNHIAAARLVSALIHRNWALRTPVAMQHPGRIDSVYFSANGRQVLSAGRDKTARIWDAVTGKLIATLQHEGRVFCAHYSSDSALIVTASADRTARIWNAINGAPLAAALLHGDEVYWAEFSLDGKWVVTAAADRKARIWDARTGLLHRELGPQSTEVVRVCFSPDGKQVAAGSAAGSIRIWKVESRELLVTCHRHDSRIHSLTFSADGSRLASASIGGRARLWNARTWQEVNAPVSDQPADYVGFSPDSGLLLTGSQDSTARLWDAENGVPIGGPLLHEGRVAMGRFSSAGQKLVTLSREHSARVWDVGTGMPLSQPIREPDEFAVADFSPDGQRLVTASHGGSIQFWDLQARRFAGLESRFEAGLNSVRFHPKQHLVLVACSDGIAEVLEPDSGKRGQYVLQHQAGVDLAEFSPDGEVVLTVTTNTFVQLWDWRRRRIIAEPFEASDRIRHAAFSPDATRVALTTVGGVVRVWNPRAGKPLTSVLSHGTEAVVMASFSPNDALVVTAGEDCKARLWHAATGQPAGEPLPHHDHVKWAEFSPDGKRIVTASTDDTARVWDIHTGRALVPPLRHTRIVERASFSPDGRRVITRSLDRTARVWDASTGEALTPPLKHELSLSAGAFSSDGQRVLTGPWNGAARVWDSRTGCPLTEPLETPGWFWRDVSFDGSGQRIATGGQDGVLRLWHVPPVPTPVPDWFPAFAEAVAGIRLGARGHPEFVSRAQFDAIVRGLTTNDTANFYECVARWFLADPAQRPLAPF